MNESKLGWEKWDGGTKREIGNAQIGIISFTFWQDNTFHLHHSEFRLSFFFSSEPFSSIFFWNLSHFVCVGGAFYAYNTWIAFVITSWSVKLTVRDCDAFFKLTHTLIYWMLQKMQQTLFNIHKHALILLQSDIKAEYLQQNDKRYSRKRRKESNSWKKFNWKNHTNAKQIRITIT